MSRYEDDCSACGGRKYLCAKTGTWWPAMGTCDESCKIPCLACNSAEPSTPDKPTEPFCGLCMAGSIPVKGVHRIAGGESHWCAKIIGPLVLETGEAQPSTHFHREELPIMKESHRR